MGTNSSTKPSTYSGYLDLEGFHRLAHHLARTLGADLFLSSPGYVGETTCTIGMGSFEELYVDHETTRDSIKNFAFSSPDPVFGFLSYTYGMGLRGIATKKKTDFPLGHLKKYESLLTYDITSGQYALVTPDITLSRHVAEVIHKSTTIGSAGSGRITAVPVSSMDRACYIAAVAQSLEHIRAGDTYQLNLSIKFSLELGPTEPATLCLDLWRRYPAPFYVLFKSDPFWIVSTSPERFFSVNNGKVLSQPIKGTLAFDRFTPDMIARLTASAKESAELSMIVDLLRNDMSVNCEVGSINVTEHKSVFRVDNLLQMYSNVTGSLRQDRDVIDLLLDAFPGGSITGCPKKRSMEIIEQLEPHSRDIYCGSFVRIAAPRTMDASIAIRTGFLSNDHVFHFFAGSGIVVDSVPEREYEETLAKAQKFFNLNKL